MSDKWTSLDLEDRVALIQGQLDALERSLIDTVAAAADAQVRSLETQLQQHLAQQAIMPEGSTELASAETTVESLRARLEEVRAAGEESVKTAEAEAKRRKQAGEKYLADVKAGKA